MLKNLPDDLKFSSTKFDSIYRGVIEDNDDPLKMGRVMVRIFGLHTSTLTKTDIEGIHTSDLPWAEPVLSILEGSISGYGLWSVPLKGSHVMIFFESGNYTQPRYFATVPGIPTVAANTNVGFNDPDGIYPRSDRLNESDFHRLARGTKDAVTSPAYNAQYPHNIVLATHGGHIIEIDSTPGNERINVQHKCGSYVELDKDGNKTEEVKKDYTLTISNNNTVTIGGNLTVNITGDATVDVGGVATITAPDINLKGDTLINGTLGVTDGNLASFSGSVLATGEVTGKGVELSTHTHGGTEPGSGSTGAPN